MKTIVVLLAICCVGTATKVKDCSTGKPPISVNILGCDSPPCKLLKGKDVQVEVQFATSKATATLKPKVVTKVLGLSVPYNLPKEQKDGCQHIKDTQCPLDAGEFVTYELSMPILKTYPSISIEIQLEMLGDDNGSQFCFKVDCQVVDG